MRIRMLFWDWADVIPMVLIREGATPSQSPRTAPCPEGRMSCVDVEHSNSSSSSKWRAQSRDALFARQALIFCSKKRDTCLLRRVLCSTSTNVVQTYNDSRRSRLQGEAACSSKLLAVGNALTVATVGHASTFAIIPRSPLLRVLAFMCLLQSSECKHTFLSLSASRLEHPFNLFNPF